MTEPIKMKPMASDHESTTKPIETINMDDSDHNNTEDKDDSLKFFLLKTTVLILPFIVIIMLPILVMQNTTYSGHPGILFAAQKPMPLPPKPMPPSQKIVCLIALSFPLIIFLGNMFYDGISWLFSSYLRNYFDINQCRRTKKRAHEICCKENRGIELQTCTNKSYDRTQKLELKNTQ